MPWVVVQIRRKDSRSSMAHSGSPRRVEYGSYGIVQERFTALKDILPDHHEVIYEYDFGDSRRHSMVLEKTVRSNAFEATYLDGRGERPPAMRSMYESWQMIQILSMRA